jgi:hypothetical protein
MPYFHPPEKEQKNEKGHQKGLAGSRGRRD